MPTKEEQEEWLATYPDGNIGLPLGPCSGLVAVDIDSDNESIIGAIENVLPRSPWRRVGKKGAVLIFKYRDNKTARIRDENDKSIVEILSRGTQIVIPPSIHPDTLKPYWSNCNLIDAFSIAPILPGDDQGETIIRGALGDMGVKVGRAGRVGVTDFVPAGSRDNAMISLAGLYAMAVSRGERTLLQALGQMRNWVETFPQKVIGDQMSVEKAEERVVQFLLKDVLGEKKKVLPIGWDEGLTEDDKKRLGLQIDPENESWDYDRTNDFLNKLISETPDFTAKPFRASIEYVLSRMAASKSISTLNIEPLLRTMHEATGKTLTMMSLRKRLNELKGNTIEGNDHAEIAEAMFKDLSKHSQVEDGVRGEGGLLWRWDGSCWGQIPEDDIDKLLLRDYAKLPAAKKAGDHKGIRQVLQKHANKDIQTVSEPGLNFANGYLTTDLVLHKHDPNFGATYTLPYRYMPDRWDRASLWTEFLYDIWGKDDDYEDKVLCLQEAIAVTMFGIAPRHQRVFCLMGVSATGKSTVRSVVENLLPPGAKSAVNPSEWGDKFLPAQMLGKVLNIAGELSGRKKIPGAKFKEVVCGETITGQHKNGQPFSFQPKCAHWFSTNHAPDSDDADDGFSRRWIFFYFNHKIAEKKQIRGYEDILLSSEREEIAAWAIQGLPRLLQRGTYTIPASSARLEAQLTEKLDSVHHFIKASSRVLVGEERHIGRPNTVSTFHKVYSEYQNFCLNVVHVKHVTAMMFRERMQPLAASFGFKEIYPENSRGAPMPAYQYLTFVDGTVV